MEKRKKVDASMHSFVYFMLGVGVFAHVMRFITKSVDYLSYAVNGRIGFPYDALICVFFVSSLVLIMKGRELGIRLFIFAQIVDAIVVRNPIPAILFTTLLLLLLQIKNGGVSAWKLITEHNKPDGCSDQ